ncbi:helix-turn-helix domain-containing protein [Nonomuraea sp. NPDC050404]|uniref:helix-turn-helix domain-containing protein n=1 Tax=Nonomuraea sp. NPDC050404 TaxID=3155783 RepID=UPI0033EEE75C
MGGETFGERLRRLRGDMSLREAARRANVGKSYIADLENGRRRPSRTIAAALDKALRAGGELVAVMPTSPALLRPDSGRAEEINDVLSRMRRRNRSVDPVIIDHLRDELDDVMLRYEQLDHSCLVPSLLRQRLWTDTLIDECSNPRGRERLFGIASGTSGMLGYLAVGRGQFPLARAYCAEAFQLGDFAQDANLQAWARGLQSFCEYYARNYSEALRLAVDGLGYASAGPQSVRLTINCVARALGKLGDVEGVHRAVDEAYELMSHNAAPMGLPSSISFDCYGLTQVASNAATAYVSLGMPQKVQQYVRLALPTISESNSPWSRSLVMIDHAVSLVSSKEADPGHISDLALDALNISAGRPIVSIQQRAMELMCKATQRWGDSSRFSDIRHAVTSREVQR